MKFFKRQYFFLLFFFFFVLPYKIDAASLNFNPKTSTVKVGDTVTVDVVIDVGTKQVAATDIYVTYDSTIVSLQSVTGSDFFPLVNNVPSANKVYISGFIANPGEYKTGSGKVATLIFKAVAEANATIDILCDVTATETSKINQSDINASNIIDCSATGEHVMTISASTGSGSAPTRAPARLPDAGFVDSAIGYTIAGSIMLFSGAVLRFLLMR